MKTELRTRPEYSVSGPTGALIVEVWHDNQRIAEIVASEEGPGVRVLSTRWLEMKKHPSVMDPVFFGLVPLVKVAEITMQSERIRPVKFPLE